MLKIAYHPIYKHPLPEGHRFPMLKYDLLPKQLLHEGTCESANFFEPEIPNDKYIVAVHEPEYFYDLLNIKISPKDARKIGFPLTEDLVERERIIADGTIKTSQFALEYGIAMNIAGGTHHAYSNKGEAFCMLNDQAIAAKYLQSKGLAKKILVIDLDVHQGNGTAEIFQNDASVFTFSMHGTSNYPFKKEQSDLDISLKKGTDDTTYLTILKETLPQLIHDMTVEGCKQRDAFVLETCHQLQIPVQCSMGGGYSPDIKIIVDAHANTFRLAQELFF